MVAPNHASSWDVSASRRSTLRRMEASLCGIVLFAATFAPGLAAAGSAPSVTPIHVVRPVTASGLAPGYRVVEVRHGSCLQPSDGESSSDEVLGRVYRCGYNHHVAEADPCWRDPRDQRHRVAVCPRSPWSHDLLEIEVARPLRLPKAHPITYDMPWALTLATGQRCIFDNGATSYFHHRRIDYACSPTGLTGVLHGLDRTQQPWTAATVTYRSHAGGYRFVEKRSITDVWYGDGGRSPAPGELPFTGSSGTDVLASLGVVCLLTGAALCGADAVKPRQPTTSP